MGTPSTAVLVVLSLLLGGCGLPLKKMNEQNAFLVAAENIDTTSLATCPQVSEEQKRECIAAVANDSRTKCKAFLDGLVLIENTSNTLFDSFTTVFSALATVFTPLSTVHGLTASATITSGVKNAVNSNIYAKASIANYQTAIMGTYYKHMAEYANALPDLPATKLIVMNEVGKIASIHAECSLAAAQASIGATLQGAVAGGDADEDLSTLTVVAKPATGESLTLRANSTVFSAGYASVTYTPAAQDDEKELAQGLLAKVNADDAFNKAKIRATAVESPTNSIVLHAPKSAHVQWQSNNDKVFTVKTGAPSTGGSGDSSKVTRSAVPGQSLLTR